MKEATYTVVVRVADVEDPTILNDDIASAIEEEGIEVVSVELSPN
jgi:hypothetical protein